MEANTNQSIMQLLAETLNTPEQPSGPSKTGILKILERLEWEMHEKGKGKKQKRADTLTHPEEWLWTKNVLGGENPVSLNSTIFYINTQYLDTRDCQEDHQLMLKIEVCV